MTVITSFLTKREMRGTFLVALSGMCYGLMGYLGTQLFANHFSVSNMLFWRFFIAMIWIFCITLLFSKNTFLKHKVDTSLLKIILLGAVSYSGTSAFYFLACLHISTGLAMVIFFSYPIFVSLFALIAGQWRINKYALGSLATVLVGLIFLKGRGNSSLDTLGVALSILSALFYATYVYSSRHNAKRVDSRLLTLFICMGTSLIFFLIACYTHTFSLPTTFRAWFYIISLGIVATALPIQLLLDGLKYISPIKASVLSVLEPVVTVLVGFILLHETMSFLQVIGVLVVLLGAILIQFEKSPSKDCLQYDIT